MKKYIIDRNQIDSIELKCLIISRGVLVEDAVYQHHKGISRLNRSPLCCNCLLLSDGTIAQLTDLNPHIGYLSNVLKNGEKSGAEELMTPFSLRMSGDKTVLYYKNEEIDTVTFPPATDFYKQKTASGLPFVGNSVLQGMDWVSFQCLWACEYAATGQPCQFCFSGADFESAVKQGKALPQAVSAADVAEIVKYAIDNVGACSVQITGGSTFNGLTEAAHITNYLTAIGQLPVKPCGEILLYITPPMDFSLIDRYFSLGASRIACSVEVWDMALAKEITPGKVNITGRDEHLRALQYIAEKYGRAKAFSNLIIGLESLDTLAEGATWFAERGIMPSASVWMPMGRPVRGTMQAPGIDYYRRVKELFGGLYLKYNLEPTPCKGLNVCIERDIWKYATGK